jgi:serine/threonine protein kinase
MSPEQARGEAVDKKADRWAFGVVLFEMLTGRGMFEGRTVSDTLAAVLMREPEWKRLPINLHPRIRLVLERCLEKEARNRYSGISDARVDIQEVFADPSGLLVEPVARVEHRSKLRTIPRGLLPLSLLLRSSRICRMELCRPNRVRSSGLTAERPRASNSAALTWGLSLYPQMGDSSSIAQTKGCTCVPWTN